MLIKNKLGLSCAKLRQVRLGLDNCSPKKKAGPKKLVQIIVGQKILVQKILAKRSLGPKKSGPKKFWSKKYWSKINFCPKKDLLKKFW